jgi:DNA topoisomerase-1
LKDNHVNINGTQLKFSFKGKKGIYHTITLKNKRLAKIVKACRDIPGKELFQYMNNDGEYCSIDSGMVNNYIQETTGNGFSAKDFRTWAGTLAFLNCLKSQKESSDESTIKKNIIEAIDEVSAKLGNTRAICRKYYVHPKIVTLYEEGKLSKYLNDLDDGETKEEAVDLTNDEKVLMRILKTL